MSLLKTTAKKFRKPFDFLFKMWSDANAPQGKYIQTRLAKSGAFFFSVALTVYIVMTTEEEFFKLELCIAWMTYAFGTNFVKKYYEDRDLKRNSDVTGKSKNLNNEQI